MKSLIVMGLGFGDEGKGLVTDYLSQAENSLVIRTTGGHQAGHTVTHTDKSHVFSSFGSGSLRGRPTYWSKECTFSPSNALVEYLTLSKLCKPILYVDALCPVTTPYDMWDNRAREEINGHGSCGKGYGSTLERHESPYKLYAQDLEGPFFRHKLRKIRDYYLDKRYLDLTYKDTFDKVEELFVSDVDKIMSVIKIAHEEDFFDSQEYESFIFEGSQGILLDKDFGAFPHVTRGNTSSKNALSMIERNNLPIPEFFYVTRCYQTRHGAGPMTNEELAFEHTPYEMENNVWNVWQGEFRKSVLDVDLLNYALVCSRNYSSPYPKNLVVTCLDQIESLSFTKGGELFEGQDLQSLVKHLNTTFLRVYTSLGPQAEDVSLEYSATDLVEEVLGD